MIYVNADIFTLNCFKPTQIFILIPVGIQTYINVDISNVIRDMACHRHFNSIFDMILIIFYDFKFVMK